MMLDQRESSTNAWVRKVVEHLENAKAQSFRNVCFSALANVYAICFSAIINFKRVYLVLTVTRMVRLGWVSNKRSNSESSRCVAENSRAVTALSPIA